MLNAAALRDFRAIVGPDNACDDPATCYSYGWNAGLGGLPKPNRLADIPPVGIVLPGSTEEVQAIVLACLKHNIRFKSHSTGWGSFASVASPNSISIDLRRMNRIEAIDERNQMAVIQPYVTAGQLQAEAMKRGLNCHIVGAGLTHSPLASAAAFIGIGITGTTTGNNARNLLSLEWVTPEGEIVRIGSSGSGAGWFTGEGPGPGFRGMIRGFVGTIGELGVFTQIGYKLYPWPGPKALERTGRHPQTGITIPEHFRLYHMVWSNWEGVSRAAYDFNKSGVAYVLLRLPPNTFGALLTATNNEFHKLVTAADAPDIVRDTDSHRHSWTLLTAASSKAEAAYKARVVRDIIERTGGRETTLDPAHKELIAHLLLTSISVPRALRPSASMASSFGGFVPFAKMPRMMEAGASVLKDDIQPGGDLAQGSSEEFWVWPNERRQMWAENAFSYDVNAVRSRGAAIRVALDQGNMIDAASDLGFDGFGAIGPLADFYGPAGNGASTWMRRIKHRFDPRAVNEAAFYIGRDLPWIAKYWPFLRKVLFFRPFRPIFRQITRVLAAVGVGIVLKKRRKWVDRGAGL